MLEDVILYTFQQCVYYVSKVSPQLGGGSVSSSSPRGASGNLKGAPCFPTISRGF